MAPATTNNDKAFVNNFVSVCLIVHISFLTQEDLYLWPQLPQKTFS